MKKLAPLCLLVSACSTAPVEMSPANPVSIEPEAFRAHVAFLADDLLEGREAGTRGYDIAAAYVATQFELMGLTPAGDHGSYLQQVPMLASWRDTDTLAMSIVADGQEQPLTFKEDFLIRSGPMGDLNRLDAEAVFVGFGIDAPERNHNDYAGLDVDGKVVVLMSGFPKGWPSEEGAYYSSGATKSATAEKHGAIGMISVYTDALEQRAPWARMTQNPGRMSLSWVNDNGEPHMSAPSIKLGGLMSPDASARLFEQADIDYQTVRDAAKESAPAGFPLNIRLKLQAGNRYEERFSSNVAGMVLGTDPALRDEYVVITAHLDGLGVGSAVDGDTIYNGAMDNATGVAAMLEAARALQADPPRRSVLFLAVTAEEKGLLGAQYFALNPTVPIESIVANVNLDMPVLTYDFANLIGFGASHSSLEQTMLQTFSDMGLGLAPDPFPQQAIFVRSDHYRFVQQGVPSIMLATGPDSASGSGDGLTMFNQFLREHYHQPSDDIEANIDFTAGARFAEVNYRLLQRIANANERPSWNPGDFFGDLYTR